MAGKGKYHGQYRIASARLAKWDYGSNAGYFVTICTRDRACTFGEVINGEMRYSRPGEISVMCCEQIPVHFPFVDLDGYVVMPNHVHLLLIFNKTDSGIQPLKGTNNPGACQGNLFGPQSQNLASVVRGFKVGVTKFTQEEHLPFAWQPRYHDHIIRDSKELEVLREYVTHNPARWTKDTFFSTDQTGSKDLVF